MSERHEGDHPKEWHEGDVMLRTCLAGHLQKDDLTGDLLPEGTPCPRCPAPSEDE